MINFKKTSRIILILAILLFSVIAIFTGNQVQARERTEDLSNLVNYPEIYTAVQELKTAHPNWTFTVLYTGLEWNTVLYKETRSVHTRSLVQNSIIVGDINDWLCPTCGTTPQDNGSWYCASAKTVAYYMDARNWLNETYALAFETLSFNSNVHTVEGVQAILSGTFMDTNIVTYIDTNGATQTINKSYAQIIYDAGKAHNVSPYHLAARVRQEQGGGGSSLISGSYTYTDPETKKKTVYTGYYNYFNIAASGDTETEIIKNGLERAKDKGWTTPELAIIGGAKFLKGGYIGNYQDTLYLQKYHVDSASKYALYSHQYQQNVSAPYTESTDVYDAYEELGILESNFNFIIPVYENMPSTASAKPGRDVTLTTEDVVVQTQTTDLSIRSGPSTGYYVKAKVPKGTKLVRIEKAVDVSSDGRYWDRVAYNTGNGIIIGYASREYLGDIETTEVVNEEVTISVMCNLRNGPASTVNTKVKQILQKGTKVTVIDKMTYSEFGHTWYRVKLADGTQGYISSAYIETKPAVKYEIEETNIMVSPDTLVTDFPNAVLEGEVLGTGAKITIGEKEYTVIMLGDVSGDGQIKSKDYMMIKNYIMGTLKLSDIEQRAADVSKDAAIKSKDYMMMKNHIMGLSQITL